MKLLLLRSLFGLLLFTFFTVAPGCTNPTINGPKSESSATEGNAAAKRVVDYASQHDGAAQRGYVGGRHFENKERNLPYSDVANNHIDYREYDVHPPY